MLQYRGVQLEHMRFIAADGADVASLLAALGGGEVFGWEKGRCAGRAEEYHVCFPDMLFQQAVVLPVVGAHDAEAELFVGGA